MSDFRVPTPENYIRGGRVHLKVFKFLGIRNGHAGWLAACAVVSKSLYMLSLFCVRGGLNLVPQHEYGVSISELNLSGSPTTIFPPRMICHLARGSAGTWHPGRMFLQGQLSTLYTDTLFWSQARMCNGRDWLRAGAPNYDGSIYIMQHI